MVAFCLRTKHKNIYKRNYLTVKKFNASNKNTVSEV